MEYDWMGVGRVYETFKWLCRHRFAIHRCTGIDVNASFHRHHCPCIVVNVNCTTVHCTFTTMYSVHCTSVHCTLSRQPGENEDREEALAGGGIDLLVVPGLAFTRQKKKDIDVDIDLLVVPGLEFTRQTIHLP